MTKLRSITTRIVGLLLLAGGIVQAQSYRMQELLLPRGSSGFARTLNNEGAAVGSAGETHGTDMSAAMWGGGGKPSDIGRLRGGDFSEAFGINDAGVVVGSSNNGGASKPFVFDGGMEPLALPSGDNSGQANAISKTGVIVGWTSGPSGQHPVRWTNGSPEVLPGKLGQALAVNASSVAVGSAQINGQERAVLWSGDAMRDLGVLVGHKESRALSINDSGTVVGYSRGDAGQHAVSWTAATGMQDLGVLGGTEYSEASGINSAGAIVGTTDTALGKHAFIWTADKGMVDLNTLIPSTQRVVLTAALGINDQGQILAIGSPDHNPASKKYDVYDHTSHAGVVRVYLLTPIGK